MPARLIRRLAQPAGQRCLTCRIMPEVSLVARLQRQSPGSEIKRLLRMTDNSDGLRKAQHVSMCRKARMGKRNRLIETRPLCASFTA